VDDAVATIILSTFSGSALSTALAGKLARSAAPQGWTAPYGIFHGLTGESQGPMRGNKGVDLCSMRFNFFSSNGPDADKALALCRALFDGVKLTLSDSTTILPQRKTSFFALRDEENPDSGLYRSAIDFQYFRQY